MRTVSDGNKSSIAYGASFHPGDSSLPLPYKLPPIDVDRSYIPNVTKLPPISYVLSGNNSFASNAQIDFQNTLSITQYILKSMQKS